MCLAVPGRVIAIDGDDDFRTARVDFDGVTRDACLAFVPQVRVGDYVLVHVGFAIAHLDEGAARQSLETWQTVAALDAAPDGADDAVR